MKKRPVQPYLELPGTDVQIPLPDDPRQEDEAVATAFDSLVAQGVLRGRSEPTIPAEDVYRELGITPPGESRPARRRKATGGAAEGQIVFRVPKSLHRALVNRAAAEGVSVDRLLLTYVSRGLATDATAAATNPTG